MGGSQSSCGIESKNTINQTLRKYRQIKKWKQSDKLCRCRKTIKNYRWSYNRLDSTNKHEDRKSKKTL